MKDPADLLRQNAILFDSRDDEYGSLWQEAGEVLVDLFPEGITLRSTEDFSKFNTIQNIVTKLRRYCHNFDKGGHIDSARDLQVYSAMLEAKTDDI